MSLENHSNSVTPLFSEPANLLPNALTTLMVTWTVEEIFGGMTAMCLRRANIFHEQGVPTAVVSFALNQDFVATRNTLVASGKLHADVPIINLHEYYDQNLPETPPGTLNATKLDGPQWGVPEETYRSDDQTLLSRDYLVDDNSALRRREYYRRDGSIYLIDCTLPQVKNATKTRRVLQLLGSENRPVAEFTSAAKLYRHWLSVIVGNVDTNLIVDSKYSAGFLSSWKHPGSVKLFAFHSTHIKAGENTLTGQLSTSHAPVIDQRHDWDGLVFLTKSQRDAFTQRFGDDADSFVISNPTEGPTSYPPYEKRNSKKVVYVGRLAGGKRVKDVIDIVDLVSRSAEGVTLDIIGDGPEREELEKHVQNLGLETTVKFLGHVSSVSEHLQHANVLLLCSSYEGQSLAILEAQAHGCVAVAYDVDFGPRDVIEHGVSGYLVPYLDKNAASEIITRLVHDSNLASSISYEGFTRAVNFNNESTFNRWQHALANARERQLLREMLTEIKPVLEAMRFLRGGAIELTVGWEEQQLDFDSLQLLIEPRGTSSLESRVVIDPSALSNGSASFSIPSDIRTTIAAKEPLDLSVRLRSGDAQAVLRLGAPKGQMLQPYLTAYGNLSLK